MDGYRSASSGVDDPGPGSSRVEGHRSGSSSIDGHRTGNLEDGSSQVVYSMLDGRN